MTDKINSSKTSIVCYFCSEIFQNSHLLQAHIKQCGSILRQCTRCRAYVERRHFDSHNRLCSKSLNYLGAESRSSNQNDNNIQYTASANMPTNSKANHSEELHYKINQNGTSNAYLVNMQPVIYNTTDSASSSNSSTRQTKERNVYALPSRSVASPTTDGFAMNDKYYTQPEYSSLDRSEHGLHVMRQAAARPLSVLSSDLDLLQYVRNELIMLRNQLNEEQTQREKLSNEMTKMRKQYLLSEERNQILLATITTLRNNIEDEAEKYKNTYSLLGAEMDTLRKKNEELMSRISHLENATNNLQTDMEREQIDRSHLDLIVNAQDIKLRGLNKMETAIEELKNEANQEQQIRKDVISHTQKEIGQLKDLISLEISKQKQQLQTIEESQADILQKLKTNTEDNSKYSILNKESKALMGIVEEDTKKIQSIEESLKNLSTSVATIQKQRYTGHLETNSLEFCDKFGHFMWKIDQFEQKLKDSVDNESILFSPIFYSSKYGYAMQAEIYLNGIGKWKGRYMTASVYVIPGQWDPLLSWPVKMTAKIVLKDQTSKTAQAIHLVKSLQVKKRDHKEDTKTLIARCSLQRSEDRRRSSENLSTIEKEARALEANLKRQYVFIPHVSLDKFDYIKNNVMFVEIVIENT